MAVERLILAHAYPTIKEVLNETNAILIQPNSYNNTKAGMAKIMENKKELITLTKNCRKDVLSKYTWDKRAKYIKRLIIKLDA